MSVKRKVVTKDKAFTASGFVKSYFLPALVTFLIPGFGLWFFHHVEQYYDRTIRESIVSQIQTDQKLTPERREKTLAYWEKVSVSKIMASNNPQSQKLQHNFSSRARTRYAIFRWMKRISLLCLTTGVCAFVAAG